MGNLVMMRRLHADRDEIDFRMARKFTCVSEPQRRAEYFGCLPGTFLARGADALEREASQQIQHPAMDPRTPSVIGIRTYYSDANGVIALHRRASPLSFAAPARLYSESSLRVQSCTPVIIPA